MPPIAVRITRLGRQPPEARARARREIFVWLARYNTKRLLSSLNYRAPTESVNQQRPEHQLDQTA